ncbi:MAG: ATP-binding protein [Pseudomonadota bacterium]
MKKLMHKSLANRILLLITGIICLLTGSLIIYNSIHNRNTLLKYAEDSGLSFAKSMAQGSLLGVIAAEPLFLEQPFSIAMSNPEVAFVAAYDLKGKIIFKESKFEINLQLPEAQFRNIMKAGKAIVGEPIHMPHDVIEDLYAPVRAELPTEELAEELLAEPEEPAKPITQTIGFIRLGFSRARISAAEKTSAIIGIAIGLAMLTIGVFLALLLGRRITGPLKELEAGTKKISDGDLDVSLHITTEDEVGAVARAFNAMAGALKETTVSKDYVDNIVGSMNEAMLVINTNRQISTMNSAAENLLKYNSSDLAGKSVDVLFIKPADHPLDKAHWPLLTSSAISNFETEYRTKDGIGIPVSLSSAPMYDRHGRMTGVVCIARDMREINSLLEQLRSHAAELERYQSVLLNMLDDNEKARTETESERLKTLSAVNSMSEGLVMFSTAEDEVILINPAARKMLTLDIDSQASIADVKRLLGSAFETMLVRKEPLDEAHLVLDITIGETILRTIRVEGIPVGPEKQRIGTMLVLRDITRERQLDNAKYELINNVSHELRTPLSIISNVISNLLIGIAGPMSEKATSTLKTCQVNIKRLSHIIDGLLSTASIDAGQVIIKRRTVDVKALVRGELSAFEGEAAKKSLKLDIELPAEPLNVYCDAEIVSKVLSNLISNAIRYTPKGGEIFIFAGRKDSQIEFSVTDTGIGIPPDEQRSVFEHFHQIGRVYGPGEKGVGLGLAVSRLLVQRHRGSIGVSSVPGKGSKFYFVIPDLNGEELITTYLEDKVASMPDEENAPILMSIAVHEKSTGKPVKDEKIAEDVHKEIKLHLKEREHITTQSKLPTELMAVVMPDQTADAKTIIKDIKIVVKEIEKKNDNIKIAIGTTICTSMDMDIAHYIDKARKSDRNNE